MRIDAGQNRWRTGGFSLVELMVALVLSLLVLGTVLTVYMSNSNSARYQAGVMRAQENGRFAIDVMSRTLRMAGYDNPDAGGTVGSTFVAGTTGSTGTTFTQSGLKADSDSVTVTYEAESNVPDCTGNYPASTTITQNQYAIWTDAGGTSHLVCNTADDDGGPPPLLAEGVEDMQILYGIDSNDDGVAERYVDADNVANWSRVSSLQVALLVTSVVPALSQDDIVCLGCDIFVGNEDRLVRAEFQTTIGFRN